MKTLLIISHDQKKVHSSIFQVMAALQALEGGVEAIVMGDACTEVIEQAKTIPGISKLWLCQHSSLQGLLVESVVAVCQQLIQSQGYQRVVCTADTMGKALLPRLAMLYQCSPVTDIAEIINEHTFKRPIYAGNAVETVELQAEKHFLSIRAASFNKLDPLAEPQVSVEILEYAPSPRQSQHVKQMMTQSDRPDLAAAKKVVSGGRGLGSQENFALVESLADAMGAAVGASRAAVDSGYVPNDYQVGQTGKIIAPDVYIAVGISGAIQHMAGMKDSAVIVAINKDPDAPIFQYADYGLVGDLFEIVPKLTDYVLSRRKA